MAAATPPKVVLGLSAIQKWPAYFASLTNKLVSPSTTEPPFPVNKAVNDKISLWSGDITKLGIDAIVNAANSELAPGGGVCGSIHRGAGPDLEKECEGLGGCPAGEARITKGYGLPAKHVIHAVGPQGEFPEILKSAYVNTLRLMIEKGLRSIAFPCISTGIYGYPNEGAADVALRETRQFLEQNHAKVDRIIFAVFLDKDRLIYEELMQKYFPVNKCGE